MSAFAIAGRGIGLARPPFLIAEMSGNHKGSLRRALAIVDAAAAAGADALKLQTYTADTMTLDVRGPGFLIEESSSLWKGRKLYDLYREAHTPWAWHKAIFTRCAERGLICFSTPFDASAVDFLEKLGTPAYKIASFENVDIPLIRRAAATGKPLIISTGMASAVEIREALAAARKAGARRVALLKCTSSYPADPGESHLATIPDMARRFRVPIGLSDHTLGVGAAIAAVALGATIVEKHFTLSRTEGGVDAAFSLEPGDFKRLREEADRAWCARGRVRYGPTASEKPSLRYRRSLYVARDMRKGEAFTRENLRAIRPGYGLKPKFYDALLGKRVRHDVSRGTPVTWRLVRK